MKVVVLRPVPTVPEVDTRDAPVVGRIGGRGRMGSWQQANKVANVAAARAHGALEVDLSAPRVDVEAAVGRADLDLFWRPMPRLFGLYVSEPDAAVGILVNSGLPRGARRHTVAHELGHHLLRHSTTVDDGSTIDIGGAVDPLPENGAPRRWTDQEMGAEAFAAWFLMPRRVVAAALRLLSRDRPESALDVYRLSVILGTSYATTLRHLPNLKLASPRDTNAWLKVPPGRLKARLDRGVEPPADRRRDVLVVGAPLSGVPVHAETGDRLVIPGVTPSQVHAPEWLAVAGTTAGAYFADGVVLDVVDLAEPHTGLLTVEAGAGWTLAVEAGPQPVGRQPRTRSDR
ncbi:ImmA/IrrE family metallo-endopeptidase [Nocardioides sp. BYT-33-1]|uniref:ImmA/IrrE family metallo-endopeptidase n=1 Tax=Nocardioides sp. BYT-33-1 TaxID=3416952 RepID=UPI003F52F2DE